MFLHRLVPRTIRAISTFRCGAELSPPATPLESMASLGSQEDLPGDDCRGRRYSQECHKTASQSAKKSPSIMVCMDLTAAFFHANIQFQALSQLLWALRP